MLQPRCGGRLRGNNASGARMQLLHVLTALRLHTGAPETLPAASLQA
jgi:hypothetical protein